MTVWYYLAAIHALTQCLFVFYALGDGVNDVLGF